MINQLIRIDFIKKLISNKNFNFKIIYSYYLVTLVVSLLTISFITYKFISDIQNIIIKDSKYVEKKVTQQIKTVSDILYLNIEHLIILIKEKKTNNEIEKFLSSIEPKNGSHLYLSTFILTNNNLTFRASGQYSLIDNINQFNDKIRNRDYVKNSKLNPLVIQIGSLVRAIKTNKLTIPIGIGILSSNNYIGSLITGITIDDFVEDLQNKDRIINVKFQQTNIENCFAINLNKLQILKILLRNHLHTINIAYVIPLIQDHVIISFNADYFKENLYLSFIPILIVTTVFVLLIWISGYVADKKIFKPIAELNNSFDKLSSDLPNYNKHNDITNSLTIEFFNIQNLISNITIFIQKYMKLKTELNVQKEIYNQASSTIKFFSKEKIKEYRNKNYLDFILYRDIDSVKSHFEDNHSEKIKFTKSVNSLIKSIELYYKNMNYQKDNASRNLHLKLGNIRSLINGSKNNIDRIELNARFEELDQALTRFHFARKSFDPYLIHNKYFAEPEKLYRYDIRKTIDKIISKNKLNKYIINFNTDSLKADYFIIYLKAFELSFIYAIKYITEFYNNNHISSIDIFFVGGKKDTILSISFTISNIINNKISKSILLYGCKIFASFNSGKVIFDNENRSVIISYPFINLS